MTVVREFRVRYGQLAPLTTPLRPDPDVIRLQMRLIREEFKEVMDELETLVHCTTPGGTVRTYQNLLKELADLRYVVEGTAVAFALPIDEAFKAVHASNMTKSFDLDKGGKVIKGPDYVPADMSLLVPDIIDHKEE